MTAAKVAAGFFVFLALWNASKLLVYLDPSYLPDTDVTYDAARCSGPDADAHICRGTETSVNVGRATNWGYRGGKLYTDPKVFLLVHVVMGATVLMLGAFLLVSTRWQRVAGWYFFPLEIVFVNHIWPAVSAGGMRNFPFQFMFAFNVITSSLFSILGIVLLVNYDQWLPRSKKWLSVCYWAIACLAFYPITRSQHDDNIRRLSGGLG